MSLVRLIEGGVHRDGRGMVRFVNSFDFRGVDRFYTLQPAQAGEVRGWVGHRRDSKWFFVVRGKFEIGVVRPDDWGNPSPSSEVLRFVLTGEGSSLLAVPPGHYTASIALEPDGVLLVFSSGRIEEAASDDFRLPSNHWREFRPPDG